MSTEDPNPSSSPETSAKSGTPDTTSDAEHSSEAILDEEMLSQLADHEAGGEEEEHQTPKIKELLLSSDPPSRYMTVLSIIFASLAAVCFSMLIAMYLKHRHHVKNTPPKAEREVIISQPLGEFRVFLKSEKTDGSELELRADLVAECTTQEACDTLKTHLAEARDLIVPVLSGATQEDVMQTPSKNLLKRKATDRLNTMTLKGKVLQIDISNMTLERGK